MLMNRMFKDGTWLFHEIEIFLNCVLKATFSETIILSGGNLKEN